MVDMEFLLGPFGEKKEKQARVLSHIKRAKLQELRGRLVQCVKYSI
jgi:hypothetical protein